MALRRIFALSRKSFSSSPTILQNVLDVRKIRNELRDKKLTVGFVPTMGALHDGHLHLLKQAKSECDVAICSIFVNPTQFGPNEDFTRYPRTFDSDVAKVKSTGAEFVFAPSVSEMYPSGHATYVDIKGIDDYAEGAARPGHFRGVATIVTKLFNIVQPHKAFFGQKDGMQCMVIRRFVRELDMDLQIRLVATQREKDGLAMSSRNVYLSSEERRVAPTVYAALSAAQELFNRGERNVHKITQAVHQVLNQEKMFKTQYVCVSDLETGVDVVDLKSPQANTTVWPEKGAMLSVAAWLGKTRLIDNIILPAPRD